MLGSTLVALVNAALIAAALLGTIPLAVLSAECLASLFPARRAKPASSAPRPRLAVVIPAHNEEVILAQTLAAIIPQLKPNDRLVVVADNCDDGTSAVARALGVEVVERNNPDCLGKGYAMDFGLRYLEADPPEVVVLMDADCHMHDGALDALSRQVVATGRPAQALYLLERPMLGTLRDSVSAFAFLLKNQVRPTGLHHLGLPCMLYGAGMAFPWHALRAAPLADGNIVEDMQLGIDLAVGGCPPQFCAAAKVSGRLPVTGTAALTQRRRWEHGHLKTIFSQVPRLLRAGWQQKKLAPLALAMDLSVPPLSLLAICMLLLLTLLAVAVPLGGSKAAAAVLAGALIVSLLCLLAAWARFGRRTLPLLSLLAVPAYITWKVPMYLAFVLRPQKQWVRTPRFDALGSPSTPPAAPVADENCPPPETVQR